MRAYLTLLAFWANLSSASAQLSLGANGMTVLSNTILAVDGLVLTPSASLTLVNNTLQKSTTALAGTPPSISRVYQFSAPILFSGRAEVNYLPAELNGYTESTLQLAYRTAANAALTVTTSSSVNTNNHYVANTLMEQTLLMVTAAARPDLTASLYARPSTVNGSKPITVVVDVQELLSVPTSGTIVVRITKDAKVSLSFSPRASLIDDRAVQNRLWTFSSDGLYYILTSDMALEGEGIRSFGLTGTISPGGTSGSLNLSAVIVGGSGGEARANNNSDSDKIEYFQQ